MIRTEHHQERLKKATIAGISEKMKLLGISLEDIKVFMENEVSMKDELTRHRKKHESTKKSHEALLKAQQARRDAAKAKRESKEKQDGNEK